AGRRGRFGRSVGPARLALEPTADRKWPDDSIEGGDGVARRAWSHGVAFDRGLAGRRERVRRARARERRGGASGRSSERGATSSGGREPGRRRRREQPFPRGDPRGGGQALE